MIPDEIGQKLLDRATRGDALTAEAFCVVAQQDLLQRWYGRLDQEEAAQLRAAPVPNRLADLQSRVQQASAQVVEQAQCIEVLAAENAQLREEIVSGKARPS